MSYSVKSELEINKSGDRVNNHELIALSERIQVAGIGTDRFIPLKDGTKKPPETGWSTVNQYEPEALPDGNYGVVAGDGLLILDIDDYEGELPEAIAEWLREHPSLVVRSPHGGTHRYYAVPKGMAERFREVLDVANPDLGVVEVYTDGSQSVGPGSQITDCSKCDRCSPESPSRYVLQDDRPIRELSKADVDELIDRLDDVRERPDPTGSKRPGPTVSIDRSGEFATEWIETARKWDDYLDRLCSWAERGCKPARFDLRFPDRSRNETALAAKLMRRVGGFEDPEGTVRELMNHYNPPKWATAGKSYQESVIQLAAKYSIDVGEYYDPDDGSGENRGTAPVIRETAAVIISAVSLIDGDKFRTEAIAKPPYTPELVGERQVRRILSDLEDYGYLTQRQIGKRHYWVFENDVPITGREFELLVEQYLTADDVREQRHEWLIEGDQ